MPAFTFEKISPPASRTPAPPTSPSPQPPKQRNVIIQILDRFVARRVKNSLREERVVLQRRKTKSAG